MTAAAASAARLDRPAVMTTSSVDVVVAGHVDGRRAAVGPGGVLAGGEASRRLVAVGQRGVADPLADLGTRPAPAVRDRPMPPDELQDDLVPAAPADTDSTSAVWPGGPAIQHCVPGSSRTGSSVRTVISGRSLRRCPRRRPGRARRRRPCRRTPRRSAGARPGPAGRRGRAARRSRPARAPAGPAARRRATAESRRGCGRPPSAQVLA